MQYLKRQRGRHCRDEPVAPAAGGRRWKPPDSIRDRRISSSPRRKRCRPCSSRSTRTKQRVHMTRGDGAGPQNLIAARSKHSLVASDRTDSSHQTCRIPASGLARSKRPGRERAPRLGVISTFTAELLRPFVIVESERLGCPRAALVRSLWPARAIGARRSTRPSGSRSPTCCGLPLRLEDVDRHLVHEMPGDRRGGHARSGWTRFAQRLVGLAQAARDEAPRVDPGFEPGRRPPATTGNVFDASDPDGFVHLVAECNRQLARDLAQIPDAHVFDYAGTVARQRRRAAGPIPSCGTWPAARAARRT